MSAPMLLCGLSVLIIVGLVGLLFYFGLRPPTNRPKEFLQRGRLATTNTLVVCAGDSITHGTMSSDYVAILREQFGPQGYEFVNAGINGHTTYDLLKRFDEIIACKPDVVTLLIGTNDVNATVVSSRYRMPEKPSVEGYRQNLEIMLKRLKTETTARIAILSLPMLGENLDSTINQRIVIYNAAIQQIAETHGVTYLPLYEQLVGILNEHPNTLRATYTGQLGLLLSAGFRHYFLRNSWDDIARAYGFAVLTDYIHLNDRAARVIAKLIAGVLKS